uniref:Uncharacterized protein n=1 Tax=Arundo donax TaxID=35708 RepID=A0A0A9C396_ARUDO
MKRNTALALAAWMLLLALFITTATASLRKSFVEIITYYSPITSKCHQDAVL